MTELNTLIRTLSESAQAVKPSVRPLRLCLIWAAGTVAYIMFSAFLLGLRDDLLFRLQSPLYLLELALLAAVILSTFLAVALLSFPDLHQRRWLAWLPLPSAFMFIAVLFLGFQESLLPAGPAAPGMECLICISLLSLAPAVWIMAVLRSQASTHYHLAGGLALLAAAGIGGFILRLCEKTDAIIHIIQWHYLPLIGAVAAGLWLGRKFIKW
jgi:hypothetical protein